ncbi:hypothetical protein SAMD00019534_063110 [Acytostelium subglobosum LB1]|uniref:hypothetical protein n=1 Tax=Acytostelium subglobosum LB1 TaxID=1410327 RepID=UPI000644C5E1|nr:hypothetical protein SAMD00019534_063110 [Acytostelium subglobosum LB1]GAM23136.1 hypothetical protein SAMD00019534_063110 [Acytostelium subglobosum LB1]|eukprot:XP_012753585.1 hypothetical protein SAMD00019534_063110 [Acytostelium subglobosum LB1]
MTRGKDRTVVVTINDDGDFEEQEEQSSLLLDHDNNDKNDDDSSNNNNSGGGYVPLLSIDRDVEEGDEMTEVPANEAPPITSVVVGSSCKKGCCGKTQSLVSEVQPETTAVEQVQSQDQTSIANAIAIAIDPDAAAATVELGTLTVTTPAPTPSTCKKGCCGKMSPPASVETAVAVDVTVAVEQDDKNVDVTQVPEKPAGSSCKKGCCGKKKTQQDQVTTTLEQPPQVQPLPEVAMMTPEVAVTTQPYDASIAKPTTGSCKKGCCGKKKTEVAVPQPQTVDLISIVTQSDATTALEQVTPSPAPVAVPTPTTSSCKKGCCGKKTQVVIPEPQAQVETITPSVSATVAVPTPTTSSCKKGCCGTKSNKSNVDSAALTPDTSSSNMLLVDDVQQQFDDESPETSLLAKDVVVPSPIQEEEETDACKKKCCSTKSPGPAPAKQGVCPVAKPKAKANLKPKANSKSTDRFCCEVCLTGPCCGVDCCKTQCCLTIQMDYGGKDGFIYKSSSKKRVFASLLYKNCGSLFGLKFGYEQQEDTPGDDGDVGNNDVELAGVEQTVIISLEPTGLTCCSDCLSNVDSKLLALSGIISVSTNLFTLKSVIVYNNGQLTVDDIIGTVQAIGYKATEVPPADIDQIAIDLQGCTTTQADNQDLAKELRTLDGVVDITFDQNALLKVRYDGDRVGARDIYAKVEAAVAPDECLLKLADPLGSNGGASQSVHAAQLATLRRLLILSIALCVPVVLFAFIIPVGHSWLDSDLARGLSWRILFNWILTTPIQFYVGLPLYQGAWKSIRFHRRANMDLLVMMSSSMAYVYSIISLIMTMSSTTYEGTVFFETSALLLTLIIFGRYLEGVARGRASDTLSKLLSLQSKTATLIVDEHDAAQDREIDIRLVQRGDLLRVLPWSQVPADGAISDGYEAFLDESMVTGESTVVHKQATHLVYGGSMNQTSPFTMRVTTKPSQSTLANICKLVEQCQSSKAQVQNQADLVASYFVPCIVLASLLVFGLWMVLIKTGAVAAPAGVGAFTFSMLFAMSVMVISCPCAVSLSTPTAVMVGSGVGAKLGVLFKGGEVIERTKSVSTIIFDKTGTLTNGRPNVTDHQCYGSHGWTTKDLFYFVGSAELGSEHIIGKSISKYARESIQCQLETPTDLQTTPGRGLTCLVDGRQVTVGNRAFFAECDLAVAPTIVQRMKSLESEGKTVVLVGLDREVMGLVALMDTPRPEARAVVDHLKTMGIDVWMVSGDNNAAVRYVAKELGIDHCVGEATPKSKSESVKQLQQSGRVVAMIGDGVNDAVALVQADVGIAVVNGTDVALEAANIVLMKPDLYGVVNAIDLARSTFRVIRFNLCWAFVYNLIGIPLASGLLYPFTHFSISPTFAGLSELLSSLPVILFSLLLNLYRPPKI